MSIRPIAALAAVAVLLLASCGGDDDESAAAGGRKLDKVAVQLDFQARGNHAMFFVGQEQGFFEKEGIEVTDIRTGTGSPDAMRIVSGGRAQFGFGDLPTLVTARSQGASVVALAAVNQKSPLGMCTKKDEHPLRSPQDLKGLTFGAHTAGSTYIFYKAFLAANGIKQSELTERTVTPPYESFLIQDHVDVVTCYIDAEVPELEPKVGGGGLSILLGSEHGYDVYGSGLFTNEKLVKSNPDLVQRFVNAYMRAFQWVIDHPEEAAQAVADSAPQIKMKKDVFLKQLQADIESTFTSPLTERNGLGAMDEQIWRDTVHVLAKQKVIEKAPAVADVYDERFVDKANRAS